jgi:hypothetical protein
MTLEDLRERVEHYRHGQSQVEENRNLWTQVTKPQLVNTLNQFITHYELTCKVQEVNTYRNYEAVNLTFGNSRSGIVKEKENETKYFNKFGGALSFSQSCNGRIDVIILFPFIEEITDKTDKKVIVQVPPAEIDEPFIYRQISRFLNEVMKWESNPQIPTVGYRFPEKKVASPSEKSLKVVIGTAAASTGKQPVK